MNQTITVTFGDVAENHIGNEKIGNEAESGFTYEELESIYEQYGNYLTMELLDLTIPECDERACVLIWRYGVDELNDNYEDLIHSDNMYEEHINLTPDSKYYCTRRKKVLNKHARHNLCFDIEGYSSNYEEGIGTVISFDNVPETKSIYNKLHEVLGDKVLPSNIRAEGNYYYDPSKCGIGYHGDTERKIVVGVRLGVSIPLCYQWFYKGSPVGDRIDIDLEHGDIYIMSEKAVGRDWKKRNIYTLRHAAGCDKYIEYKSKSINSKSDCSKVVNPKTGRMIKVGGKVYKDLVREGLI